MSENYASELSEIYTRLGKLNAKGIKTPQTVKLDIARVEGYRSFELTELSIIQCEKLIARIQNNLVECEKKDAPKSTVYVLGERHIDADSLMKRAILYAEKRQALVILRENFQRREIELQNAMSEAESKISLAQSGQFSALVKQASERMELVYTK